MKKLQPKEIKLKELELLLTYADFCNANNLYYTICGGTLLGAIRHKGFIPWDDDIDVLMPRPFYDKILHNLDDLDRSMIPEHISFDMWTNKKSDYPFIKMVNKRVTVQNPYVKTESDYLWIDIFPIDGNPSDDKKLGALYGSVKKLRKLLSVKSAKTGTGKTAIKKFVKPIIKAFMIPVSKHFLCKLIDQKSKEYDFETSKQIGGVLWGYGPQERINKEKYMTPISVEFEGHFVNAPSNYDEYLTGLYGDYMTLPPVEKRINHEIVAYEQEDE